MRNTLTGNASRPRSTLARCHAPGVTVVALLPSDGPVPPPPMVVIPVEIASTIWDAERMCTWLSTPPAVRIRPSPEITSVDGADDQVGVDAVGDVGVAGSAQCHDSAVPDAHVGLDDAPVVEDDDVGDDGVEGSVRAGAGRLEHRLTDRLAPAEDRLVAADGAVLLDLHPEVGVTEADLVTDRGAVQRRIPLPVEVNHRAAPRPRS